MKRRAWIACLVLACAVPATAQSSTPKGFLSLNALYQVDKNDFKGATTGSINAEPSSMNATYAVTPGFAFDVAGGARVWGKLGFGVGISRYFRPTATAVTASIPHPFFFNQPRTISGAATGLSREELAVHLQARGMFASGRHLLIMLFGGPSLFQVKQGVVTDVTYSSSYPYDTATFGSATTTSATVNKMGFNAGVDVGTFFSSNVGVGFGVQFAGVKVNLPSTGSVKAGGTQAGFGLRLRF